MSLTANEETTLKKVAKETDLEEQLKTLKETRNTDLSALETQKMAITDQYDIDAKVIQDQIDAL